MFIVLTHTPTRFYPTQAARIRDMALQGNNIHNTASVCGTSPIAIIEEFKQCLAI
jgi:hypothetical protein